MCLATNDDVQAKVQCHVQLLLLCACANCGILCVINWFCSFVFQFTAEELSPRTIEMHEHHCRSLEGPLRDHTSTAYGVSRNSILNSLKYYHVVNGKYMHVYLPCMCWSIVSALYRCSSGCNA